MADEPLEENSFPELTPLDDELTPEEIERYENQGSQGGGRNLTDIERSGGNISDFKALLRTLIPDWSEGDTRDIRELAITAKAIMITNVGWDSVVPHLQATVNSIVIRHARDKVPPDPMTIYNVCYSMFFSAINAKRVVDLLVAYGSAGNSEEETKENASALGYK